MRSSPDEAALLRELVAIPSVSGSEAAIARYAAAAARSFGLRVESAPHGVVVTAEMVASARYFSDPMLRLASNQEMADMINARLAPAPASVR